MQLRQDCTQQASNLSPLSHPSAHPEPLPKWVSSHRHTDPQYRRSLIIAMWAPFHVFRRLLKGYCSACCFVALRVPIYTAFQVDTVENVGCTILDVTKKKRSFLVNLWSTSEPYEAEGRCRVAQSIEAMRSNWNDIRKGRMSFLVGTSAAGPSQGDSTLGAALNNSVRFERAKRALSAHLARHRHQSGQSSSPAHVIPPA